MGKQLNLGRMLKYPITITKLLKKPGETFQKKDPIFQYTFTWKQTVGDPFGEQWEETQVTPADWDSPADGTLLKWKIHEGMIIDKDTSCAEIEETCSHAVQFAGLCAICGKDMNETSWAAEGTDADRATVKMIHDQTLLSVSRDEASRAEEQLQRRLLKSRKLSLVVDLDQTIIHACIEPTVGEWQRDPTSPNYEAVKDVKAFQLSDDGPRGLTSGCWYYIKMRPGLKEFLTNVAEIYELHVYTMGTRAYAQAIAKIVDPDRKLFGDRIISRDESGSMEAKTLSRLFPVDTKMVVIIDDRADVWPRNRLNLIKVVPYDFFVGIGDINSSFLPKRQEVPRVTAPTPEKTADPEDADTSVSEPLADEHQSKAGINASASQVPGQESGKTEDRTSALEELVSMSGGDDPTLRRIQAEEQEEFLEKQLKERPLLHMQQELDKEDGEVPLKTTNGESEETAENGDTGLNQPNSRHHLLKDDDRELNFLGEHLKSLHKAFYDEYDIALAGAQGGRVAHLRPGATKKMSMKDESADLQLVPDIGDVMPRLKAKTLAGTIIVLSGLVPLGTDIMRSEIVQQTLAFGSQVQARVSRKLTHLVVSANRTRTHKVRQAAKYPHIKIVNQQWLLDSMSRWEKMDETPYLINIHRDTAGEEDSAMHSINSSSDEDGEDDASEAENDDNGQNNEQDEDPEGVMPDHLVDPNSPIEEMQKFDWGESHLILFRSPLTYYYQEAWMQN